MSLPKSAAVFLDRDGVLNRTDVREGRPYAIRSLSEFELLPGVASACGQLKRAGYKLVVVTNQPDVSTGKITREEVEMIHDQLRREIEFDAIKVCYEDDESHPMKKPNPGMLLEAASELGIDLSKSWMVGDRWRDIGAGQQARCCTIWIDCGYAEKKPEKPDYVVGSLKEATDVILAKN